MELYMVICGTPTNWSYDWVGNRGIGTDYNAVDEYLSDNGQVYDELGNLAHVPDATASARTDYSYSPDNLLHEVTDVVSGVGTTATMTWNAAQQRVRVQRGTYDRRFIYDPTASVPAVLFTVENTYGYDAYYVREPGGELLSSCANGYENMNYNYDALGSVALCSEQGGVVDASAYDAWGNTIESVNSFVPYRFVGQLGYYSHEASDVGAGLGGLMQLGVRFYDAEVGRFTQRDPAKDGINYYVYGNDDPVNNVDPTGLACKKDCNQTTFLCTFCELYLDSDQCTYRCSLKNVKNPKANPGCIIGCKTAMLNCGLTYCGSSSDYKGFTACAKKALDKIFTPYPYP